MEFLTNNDPYLRGVNYLKKQLTNKGYDWDVARMKPMDGELYANRQIEVGGTVSLLDGASTELRGTTNFNGNKLVKGRVFVANGVAFGWAEGDATDEPHALEYNYSEVPAYLKHANLVLKQKDEAVIKLPIISIINGQKDGSKYRDLGALSLIEDESIVDYDIEFPTGVKSTVASGKKLFVSAYLRGIETYLKR